MAFVFYTTRHLCKANHCEELQNLLFCIDIIEQTDTMRTCLHKHFLHALKESSRLGDQHEEELIKIKFIIIIIP